MVKSKPNHNHHEIKNKQMLLSIKNLHASINGKEILKGIDLAVNQGEVHAERIRNYMQKNT